MVFTLTLPRKTYPWKSVEDWFCRQVMPFRINNLREKRRIRKLLILRDGKSIPDRLLASCSHSERESKMTKAKRGRYTLEFKQQAARLIELAMPRGQAGDDDGGNHQQGAVAGRRGLGRQNTPDRPRFLWNLILRP